MRDSNKESTVKPFYKFTFKSHGTKFTESEAEEYPTEMFLLSSEQHKRYKINLRFLIIFCAILNFNGTMVGYILSSTN